MSQSQSNLITVAYQYAGCYNDAPDGNNHVLTVNLGTVSSFGTNPTLQTCLSQCDQHNLSACGLIPANPTTGAPAMCLGGRYSNSYAVNGKVDDAQCDAPCAVDGGSVTGRWGGTKGVGSGLLVAVYEVGGGGSTFTYQGANPAPVRVEVTPQGRNVKWTVQGCVQNQWDASFMDPIMNGDAPEPDDCLALCGSLNHTVCGIDSRSCYGGSVTDPAWQKDGKVDMGNCNSPCRYAGSGTYKSCGGLNMNGPLVSVYSVGTPATNQTSPSTSSTSLPTPQATQPSSVNASLDATSNSPSTLSQGAIAGIVIGTLLFLLIPILAFLCHRRRKRQEQDFANTYHDEKPTKDFNDAPKDSKRDSKRRSFDTKNLRKSLDISRFRAFKEADAGVEMPLPTYQGEGKGGCKTLEEEIFGSVFGFKAEQKEGEGDVKGRVDAGEESGQRGRSSSKGAVHPLPAGDRSHIAPWERD
ncbi:hypothetical protein HDV00_001198 [Rhizophlyctis rosea]|nr:hypothetical protein HDV00_001198 [Rhizophlyctis rosea]